MGNWDGRFRHWSRAARPYGFGLASPASEADVYECDSLFMYDLWAEVLNHSLATSERVRNLGTDSVPVDRLRGDFGSTVKKRHLNGPAMKKKLCPAPDCSWPVAVSVGPSKDFVGGL